MIATIIEAQYFVTLAGRDCIKLRVLDDYERKRTVFINPEYFNLDRIAFILKTPVIRKPSGLVTFNVDNLINKIIPVYEKTFDVAGGKFTTLLFDYSSKMGQ